MCVCVCVCVGRLVNRAGPGVFSVGLCGGERPERNQLCSGGEAGGTVQTERSPALTTRPQHRLFKLQIKHFFMSKLYK